MICTTARARLSLKELLKWGPTTIILDEAHMLRNSKGSRQKLNKAQALIKEEKGLIPINKSILKTRKKSNTQVSIKWNTEREFVRRYFLVYCNFKCLISLVVIGLFIAYFYEIETDYFNNKTVIGFQEDKDKELQELLDYCSSNNKQSESMKWLIPPKNRKN